MNLVIRCVASLVIVSFAFIAIASPSSAKTAAEINQEVDEALNHLYATSPAARDLSTIAKAILVFPGIVKGGFIVGGQYGEGALVKGGKKSAYYNTVAASYGLQAGLQKFGYALFFTDEASLKYLESSDGWELGVGPTIVIVDEGLARNLSTSTAREGIYAFFFDQKGLMAGLGIQGTKITRINP
jgi:lipid-binding SYLF domain-containing protein